MPYFAIIIIVIIVSSLFLYNTPFEFPTGDSYIHFLYAKNLVENQELTFNPGIKEGIGTTSFLWVLTLAVLYQIGIPLVFSAKFLGILFLCLSGCLAFEVIKFIFDNRNYKLKLIFSFLLTLLIILPGSMIWLALSGMETTLFIFLCFLSLCIYIKKRYFSLGFILGLLSLTRIEGIILAGSITLIEMFKNRRITVDLLKLGTIFLLILSPWLFFLQAREGMPSTNSLLGRKMIMGETERILFDEYPWLKWLVNLRPVFYFFIWLSFSIMFIPGVALLPGPRLALEGNIVGWKPTIPIFGVVFMLFFSIPLFFLAIQNLWKRRRDVSLRDPRHSLISIIIVWFFLHNIAYAVFLCSVGAAGRYCPMNHMVFWMGLFGGAYLIKNKTLKYSSISLCILFVLLSINYWYEIYHKNIEAIVNVRLPAVRYINDNISQETPVGAFDIGLIGYYANQPVVDLGGHINKEIVQYRKNGGTYSDYLDQEGLCYLMLYGPVDGVGLDFRNEMGISNDPRFGLIEERVFSMSVKDWEFGSEPLGNYLPAVYIYKIDWLDKESCENI